MAKKKASIPKYKAPARKRSLEVPLLWIGAVAFIGFPLLRDATADPMSRNRYTDRASCECDYGGNHCSWDNATSRWVGPWYARRESDRQAGDPGWGACRTRGPAMAGYLGGSRYVPPQSVESGYRGGFGGTGRVRAAGS